MYSGSIGSVPADALLPRRRSRSKDGHRSPSPSSSSSVSSSSSSSSASSSLSADYGRLQGLRRFLQGCSRLTALNCDYPSLNDEDLWVLSRACPYLKALSIVSSPMPAGRFGDEGLVAIANNCVELRHLRLRVVGGYACFTDRAIDAFARAYKGRLLTFALEWLGLSFRGSAVTGPPAGGPIPSHGLSGPTLYGGAGDVGSLFDFTGSSMSGPGGGLLLDQSMRGDPSMPVESAVKRFSTSLSLLISLNPGLKTLSLDWPVGARETLEVAAGLRELEALRVGNFSDVMVLAAIVAANKGLKRICLTELPVPSRFDPAVLFVEAAKIRAATPSPSPTFPESSLQTFTSPPPHLASSPGSPAFHLPPTSLLDDDDTPASRVNDLELDGVGRLNSMLEMLGTFTRLTRLRLSPSRMTASLASARTDELLVRALGSLRGLVAFEVPVLGNGPLVALSENCVGLEELDVVEGGQ
ncbi:hypothetical protein HDU67_000721, partial [Dinochytrium kinnereticum]